MPRKTHLPAVGAATAGGDGEGGSGGVDGGDGRESRSWTISESQTEEQEEDKMLIEAVLSVVVSTLSVSSC
jgi:hypothetical protein